MMKYLQHLGETSLMAIDSRHGLWHAIRQHPLKKRHVIFIATKLGLQQKDTAELIGMSVRTYQRQKSTANITNAASENVIKLAELYETGLTTFDRDEDSFHTWLNATVPALNNEKPIDLLSSNLGIELVKDELLRIEYGIY